MNKLQPVRGTKDLMMLDYLKHQYVVESAYDIAKRYGYAKCATPIFEFSEVFKRSLGDYSDVVTKEMYTFIDKGGEEITLRPEFTAGIIRAIISNSLTHNLPLKLFSTGPLFRYERPQKGRLRQFHQINFECIGIADPLIDSETIALASHILNELGLTGRVTLELNSLGDKESREAYHAALVEYLTKHEDKLSEESKIRLQKNPLRVLDSKNEGDKLIVASAPTIDQFYTEYARLFFNKVKKGLDVLGVEYKVNPYLVRGLDYYSHTAFEFTTTELGAQSTVLGGGRYDGLMKLMGGPETPAVGFAAGVERLVEMLNIDLTPPKATAIITIDNIHMPYALEIAHKLRERGEVVEVIYDGNPAKKMKRADKLGCYKVIIIGPDELAKGMVKVRDMVSGGEELVNASGL